MVPFKIDLTDKVAAVTGGGGVLCGAFAKALAECGAKVAVLDLRKEAADATAKLINDAGGTAMGVAANVLEKESLESADEIVGTWGNGIWYRNLATNTWTRMYGHYTSGDIAGGDFTSDGRADVASLWSSGLWYQNGATLGWTKVYNIAPYVVTAGNMTGDRRAEIIGTWVNGIFYFYWTGSSWGWRRMFNYKPDGSSPSGDIAAGDFNRDGTADVASCWRSGLWYQSGRTLGWRKVYRYAPNKVTAGDITGDGRPEIVGTYGNGIWYWNEATGRWTRMYSHYTSGDITGGNFSGDNRADVASCWSSGLWYQNGATLGWTKVYSSAPHRMTSGNIR